MRMICAMLSYRLSADAVSSSEICAIYFLETVSVSILVKLGRRTDPKTLVVRPSTVQAISPEATETSVLRPKSGCASGALRCLLIHSSY